MDETQPALRRSWRPRISLLSALLLMTIVGMVIVIVQLWREIGPLRAELHVLRNEVGQLTIEDRTKLCAIRVRTADEYTWKWRIWIPEGGDYMLNLADEKIPKAGFPASNGQIRLDTPGELWIEYRVAGDPQASFWFDKLSTPAASVTGSYHEWVRWKSRTMTDEGVGYTTEVSKPDGNLVLARDRISQKAADSDKIEDPSVGFMIWLEPFK